MTEPTRSLFEQMGGEPALRLVIDEFVDRMFDDVMIGYFFARVSREHIKRMEYEFAAQKLGADVLYSGRSLEVAHRAHRIFDGQFLRRLTLLRETLERHGVPESVKEFWLRLTESERDTVVAAFCESPAVTRE
ncbi:MAG TPA: group 1 truncated hemoglobin [Polyangiaceae bacterium]|nr:group 1 truncated hemoglobin [Polyangiaceae bacterium]